MIYKKCVMTIDKNKATLDEDIYLYRLDKNIELYFTIVNNKYRFNKGDMNNIILITNASFFQVRLYKNAEIKYTFAIQPTDGGQAILTITDDLIDDPIETGDYDFQISLLDEEKTSMISMPIVSKQLHVCEPLVSDDATMGKAILGLSKLATGEIKNAFDSEGNYIREIHQDGDILSARIINKFEEALDTNTKAIKNGTGTSYDDTAIKKDINAIKTDLGTKTLNTTAKDVKGAVNEVAAQCKDIANKTITTEERTKLTNLNNYDDSSIKNDIQTQKARIDSFISLKEGSTTGDAELIDGRIGADGITYDNLGNAIRGQLNKINKITDILPTEVLTPNIRKEINTQLGSCDQNGNISQGGVTRRVTDYLDLYKYGTFYFSDDCVNDRNYWLRLFDENKKFIANYNPSATNTKVTSQDVLNSYPLAKYGVFSIKCTNPNDGSLETRSTIFYGDAYSINNTVNLNNVYKKIDFNGILTKEIQFEVGGMDRANGNIVMSGFTTNLRTPFFIKVIGNTELKISFNDKNVDIIEYDKNLNYVKYTDTNNKIMLNKNTKYIKIHHYNKAGINYEKNITITLHSDEESLTLVKNNKASDIENFAYKLNGEDYYTNGKLKLPPNYDVFGKAVPLIVFVHGSADFYGLEASKMTTNYDNYYNYLRDCGYAIFDCYGWGNKYSNLITGTSTWGTPTNMNCYLSGIRYVLDKYNIDRENIFVSGKSLGGIQAFALCYQNKIKINACGLLAPALNPLHQNFGYSKAERMIIAEDFGFSPDLNNVLNTDNFTESDNYINYIKENAIKMCGWNPYWNHMILDNDTKVLNGIKLHDGKTADYSSVFKTCNVPLKVWVADDDININPYAIKNVVKAMNNAGCLAEIRTMPNGTGGHHSVDNDTNAPQTTNVTTKLGIHYDSVPTAYYELREYFDKYLI